jgi:Dos2-interacting transcription regulator of RNA-Pol-II
MADTVLCLQTDCRGSLLRFNITRETLVEALEATFTATPLFAPLFIPLALDKLASSVRHRTCMLHCRHQTVMSFESL